MKNYRFVKRGTVVSIDDADLNTIKSVDNQYLIDYVWIIEEDGVFSFQNVDYEVKAGDAVLSMYYPDGENDNKEITIIRDKKIYDCFLSHKNHRAQKYSI